MKRLTSFIPLLAVVFSIFPSAKSDEFISIPAYSRSYPNPQLFNSDTNSYTDIGSGGAPRFYGTINYSSVYLDTLGNNLYVQNNWYNSRRKFCIWFCQTYGVTIKGFLSPLSLSKIQMFA